MPETTPLRRQVDRAGLWFGLLVVLVFCSEALGYAAGLRASALLPRPAAWAAFAAVAISVGAAATALLDWLVLDEQRRVAAELAGLRSQAGLVQVLQLDLAGRTEQQRKLRHDIRGALSPVLLVADRLVNHADPAVKRSGDIMVRTVERATSLLAEHAEAVANPPDHP